MDARQYRFAVGGRGATAIDLVGHQLLRMRLAFFRGFRITVDQYDLQPGERADIGDAAAHESGAEHADFFQRLSRHGRPPRPLVQLLQRDEQRADHRRRFWRVQDFGEPARLDPQRLVDRQLQALIDDLHDGARRRVIIVGLAAIDGVRRREHHHAGFGIDRAARQFEAVDVPWRLGGAARFDPVFRRFDQIALRHHGVDKLHRLGAIELQLIALEQELQRVGRGQHARNALRAAGARKQTDLDLGQTEPGSPVVGGDAMMAGERQLETAADRGAVDGGNPRLAAGLDAPVQQRQPAALVEQPRICRFGALRCRQIGEGAAQSFQHRQIGAGAERVLARRNHHALDRAVGRQLLDDGRKLLDHFHVDDVHRAARRIPGDERNAVAVDVEREIGVGRFGLSHTVRRSCGCNACHCRHE